MISMTRKKKKRRELKTLINTLINQKNAEYYIIDIRETDAYRESHIPTAVNVSLEEIRTFFPTDGLFANIILCGQTDKQSGQAAKVLSDTAYFRVENFGAYRHWDGKTEKGKGVTGTQLLRKLRKTK
jgi:rhodanese-related sulfurtransferase